MRTKFIKVSTADRLPEKEGRYVCLIRTTFKMYPNMPFNPDKEDSVTYWKNEVDYWFLEVPDYEEELESMVDELIWELRNTEEPGKHVEMIDKANSLLTKIK